MKNVILFSILTSLICLVESCSKEKTCSKLPEGMYQGWFTNDGSSSSTYNPDLQVTKLSDDEFIINASTTSGYTVQRNECQLSGKMGAMIGIQFKTLDIEGEITHKKGDYIISGTYSYIEYSSGGGNPNPQSWEVTGTFEIKSN